MATQSLARDEESTMPDDIFPQSLRDNLVDDSFDRLKNWFEAKGRGRRCALPDVTADYCLFLQMHLLRLDYGKTWQFVEELLCKIFPLLCSCPVEFRGIFDRCVREFRKQLPKEAEYQAFLAQPAVKLPPLVEYSRQKGVLIGPEDLVNLDIVKAKVKDSGENGVSVTKEFVVKVERFRKSQNLPRSYTFKLLECYGVPCNCDEKKGRTEIETVLKDYEKKVKSRNKTYGADAFKKFCQELFHFTFEADTTDTPLNFESSKCTSASTEDMQDLNIDEISKGNDGIVDLEQSSQSFDENCASGDGACNTTTSVDVTGQISPKFMPDISKIRLGIALKFSRIRVKKLETEVQDYKLKADVISQELQTKQEILYKVTNDFKKLQKRHSDTVIENNRLKNELQVCQSQTHLLKLEEEVQQKDKELISVLKEKEKLQKIVSEHEKGLCAKVEAELKQKLKNTQTSLSDQKQINHELRAKNKAMKVKVTNLTEDCDRYILQLDEHLEKTLETKEGNRYSDEIVKCTIQLIGEAGIPALKCPQVIQCVGKCIFEKDIPSDKLPSLRSSLRFADRGHILAKMHLAESLQTTKGFDLLTDGTTRNHRKYVGNQATLSDGSVMSLGYTMVVTEDTETLVDVATSLLTELADVYASSQYELEASFKLMLKNMVALMSDRASVMKSFNNAFNAKRDEILGDDTQLQFIYCSAHFLLGLSSEGEKAIKDVQVTLGKLIGRDTLAVFKSFKGSGESAVSRLVRTACDVLGPRGDDKSGCRDAWEAYCQLFEITSNIKSYRGNRFNNFFESAVAILYHREDIIIFFSKFNSKLNLKLQSVLADLKSDEVVCLLAAIGITYFVVTGPYWNLIRSSIHYLDLYRYIEPMTEKFEAFGHDPSPLLKDKTSIIPGFEVKEQDLMLLSLSNVPNQELLHSTLQKVFRGFHAVALRQLNDFLPGGIYHDVKDPDLRDRMKHCQLTNLTGEANLADLDFSIFTRRHSSLHYRSFLNMMNRNKTMSSWFNKKSAAEQGRLLKLSAKKASILRRKHVQEEKEVIVKRQQGLEKTKQDLEAQRFKISQRKSNITATVKKNGGPCLSPRDVDALVKKFENVTAQKVALNAEIQFQKSVLGIKSPLLKTSRLSCDVIARNLKALLLQTEKEIGIFDSEVILETADSDDEERLSLLNEPSSLSEYESELEDSEDESWSEQKSDSESESDDESSQENEDTGNYPTNATANEGLGIKRSGEQPKDQPSSKRAKYNRCTFTKQGAWVAVLYTDDDPRKKPAYFIGQVLDVKDNQMASVTFMEKCGLKKNTFKFPPSPDIDEKVAAAFVFYSDFEVTSSNGRLWSVSVTDMKSLEQKFKDYVKRFCD